MRRSVRFEAKEAEPERRVVLKMQGIPPGAEVSARTEEIVEQARRLFLDTARPAAVIEPIAEEDFFAVYEGEGRNDPETPILAVCPRADHLALFAATLGQAICSEIDARFDTGDFPVGSMLDSFASAGAEKIASLLERERTNELRAAGSAGGDAVTLAYSPGYCGWNVSGQKKLFARLRPDEAGIALKPGSHIMVPIKSISGVLVSGEADAHFFDNDFPACEHCRGKTCLVRRRDLRKEMKTRGAGGDGA